MSDGDSPTTHHLTIDVEEIYHSTLLTERVPPEAWDSMPRRAPEVTDWILEEMAGVGATGTFFTLGWLADKEPALIKTIAAAGHEIAAHSWWHRKVDQLSAEDFRDDVRRTKARLEDLCGSPVLGFRAPSFSIRPGTEWAFDVLIEEGYHYDSSLFPIRVHPDYGYPTAGTAPHWIDRSGGRLIEFPLLTVDFVGGRLPAAGGAYLRFFPAALPIAALNQSALRKQPGTLYVHPWDLDPGAPRFRLPRHVALRLHGGANAARKRLKKLLSRFEFRALAETAAELRVARAG